MSKSTNESVQKLTETRQRIKDLVQKQMKSKMGKRNATNSEQISQFQSEIALQRQELAAYTEILNDIHSELSKIPYGQNNLVSKIKQVSTGIDAVKAEYKLSVRSQAELKKNIQKGFFTTVSLIADAQKQKQSNSVAINKITAHRKDLKVQYKALTDKLYFQKDTEQAA